MSSNVHCYPVVGRKDTGGIFDRLPIETLQKDQPHQFALFILAYIAVQQRPDASQVVEPAVSFMEIAGIHGRPYREWAGDRNQNSISDYNVNDKKDTCPVPSRFGGYCNHGAVVFPTWHRPYVMLIEQAIGNVAVQLAKDIEANNPGEGGVWIKAAKELRFPYWDWAEKDVEEKGLPPVLVDSKVEITTAAGKKQTVDNPLAYFTYVGETPGDFTDDKNDENGQTMYFTKWRRTYRYAVSSPNPGDSQTDELHRIDALQKNFKKCAGDLRRKVGRLFAFNDDQDPATTWDEFSNHKGESKRGTKDYINWTSIEGVHDCVHILVGGNGHMNDPDYAAFDPIFFLHHANVDRILALWEWSYTEYWMEDEYQHGNKKYSWTQELGTYAQVYNERLVPNGPLQPFRTEKGEYWTSNQARSLDANAECPKYYSYPEVAGVKVDKAATSAQERALARKRIALYYGFDPQSAAGEVSSPTSHWSHLPVPDPDHALAHGLVPDNHNVLPNFRAFAVHVTLAEHAYNRSYSFELQFKGNENSAPQLIGSITVFARPDNSPCSACNLRRETGSVVHGVIPIPHDVIDSIIKSRIPGPGPSPPDLKFDDTLDHMKGHFIGRLLDANGSELATAEGGTDTTQVAKDEATSHRVTPVEISLVSVAIAEHGEDDDKPVYVFDWQHHDSIFIGGWLATHSDSQ